MTEIAAGAWRSARPMSARSAFVAIFALSLFVAALLSFPRAEAVWRTGAFFDSDDAMRAVQLRDWRAGQGWFDVVAHRVDPPGGLSMHWSRLVDAPLAALDFAFSRVLPPEQAERATRLVFPFALLAALLALAGWLAGILSGAQARLGAIWLTALSGPMFLQFAPGRIDHHAPQIVTLAAALGFLLQGLDPRQAGRLALAAALMALSMAISLENLPFFVVMMAAPALLFLFDGAAARAQLLSFSVGALLAFPALYAATVARPAWFASACDAYSFVHLAAVLAGAVALLLLALLAPRCETRRARLIALGLCAASALAPVILLAPHCLGDPLGGLDPLIRDLWLSHVAEAKPLLSFYASAPGIVVATAAPVALGLLTAGLFAWRSQDVARRRWLTLAATIAVGFAAGLWQTRVFTSVTPVAMVALAAGVVAAVSRLEVSQALRVALVGTIAAIVSPVGLALALPPGADVDPESAERACLAPDVLAPLAELPPARVLASFNLGAHLLAHTPHSVFAAPYHRNNHGNRIAAEAFLATPEAAEALLRKAGVGLVVWCPQAKSSPLVSASPQGLAAMLARGDAPAYLARQPLAATPLLVFALRPVE